MTQSKNQSNRLSRQRFHRRTSILLGALLAIVAAAGCGGTRPAGIHGVTVVDEDEVLEFGPADTTFLDPSYRLGPGDHIEMRFLFDRSLDAQILVRPDGGINLPILGDVNVVGQTPGALSEQIAAAYGQYYTNPQLSINLLEFAPAQCYVLGEVRSPRAVEIRPGMTALGAVAVAGGPTELAALGSTVLMRRITHNRAVARRVDLKKFARGAGVSSDLYLNDFDIIYVPRSFVGKLTVFVKDFVGNMINIPVLYLRGWEVFNTDRVYNRIIRPSEVTESTSTLPPAETPR